MSYTLQDPGAYLQRRVALFAGVAVIIFSAALVVDLLAPAKGEALLSSTRVASLSVVISCGIIWLLTRKGERPMWQSRTLELLGLAVATVVFSTLPLLPPVPGAGGIMALMAPIPLSLIVMLRAAVIPSPAWLSALVTLLWGALMSYCSVLGWEQSSIDISIPGQSFDPSLFPLVVNATAAVGLAFVAGVVSRVVHGLQDKVREAMQLGQYTLQTKIGEGGMGQVYRARHAMLRRPTAIKLLPPDKSSEQAIARFEQEVQQTSRLTHPNTVAIFDFGRTQDGIFYYAMEYLEGISLQQLIDITGPLPESRAIFLLLQAAEALAEAHGMGLVHRDIKPDNIVLCEQGGQSDVIKVVDFGLVKDIDTPADAKLSSANLVQGTPLYMAPEALTDPDAVDARTDLYALGAVAYYLLTGHTMFTGKVVEVLSHHLHTQPKAPSEHLDRPLDKALERIIMRCLEKKPKDRFQSAEALSEALADCVQQESWTRKDARRWWDEHRDKVIAQREESTAPSGGTIATAHALPSERARGAS